MPNRGQGNPYKGTPPTPWVKLKFEKADGTGTLEKELGVDTGDPGKTGEFRISKENLRQLKLADGPEVETNFGTGGTGWVCIRMPDLGLEK